jgi:hypothetical protein
MASYDIFTPENIALKMSSYFKNHINKLLEPSVGKGNLLNSMAGKYDTAFVYDINIDYLNNIKDSKNIIKNNENFLSSNHIYMYDGIILNPPYLKFQSMSNEMRKSVKNISNIISYGNIDLYVAFLIKCIELLSDDGIMVAVVPSTWLYNKSCQKFREYLFNEKLIQEIYDYNSNKIFEGIDVYCCILVVNKQDKIEYIHNETVKKYVSIDNIKLDKYLKLSSIASIQNGIATLSDSVFIHNLQLFPEKCWKPILKVSKNIIRYCIFPYNEDGSIIDEITFQKENPETYNFLLLNKSILELRDRGHKKYETWYAYGRKQGLRVSSDEYSIYMSTLSNQTIPTYIKSSMLFYSGIRISQLDYKYSCKDICNIIEKNKDILISKCSKRGNNWINITVGSLKDLPLN